MADRSFEEQVREELDELRLSPDAAVWENLEAALQKEKKRRWLIWLFLFIGVCAAGFLWIYSGTNHQQKITVRKQSIDPVLKNHIDETAATNPVLPQKTNENKPATEQSSAIVTDQSIKKYVPRQENINPEKGISTLQTPAGIKENKNPLPAETDRSQKQNIDKKEILTDANTQQNIATGDPKNAISDIHKEQPAVFQLPITVSTDSAGHKESNQSKTISPVTDSAGNNTLQAAEKKIEIKNKYPWKWGIGITGGHSTNSDLSIFPKTAITASGPSNIGSGAPAPVSPNRSGAFSFGINGELSKQLNRRYTIRFTAGYDLYRTAIGIGKKIDSAIYNSGSAFNLAGSTVASAYYYTSTNEQRYINNYHFIHAGAEIEAGYKLSNTLSLGWNIGLGGNILVASHSLYYHPTIGILLPADYFLHTFYPDVSLGLNIGIGNQQRFYIGPRFNYFLKQTSDDVSGKNRNLLRLSLKLGFILPQKKKTVQR